MTHIKLAERSASLLCNFKVARRHIGLVGSVVTVALVLFSTGFYAAILLSSPTLPSSDRVDEFYRAQAGQDKWIFETLMGSNVEATRRRGGFFIEFGARNGIEHSNTYFFETFLDWYGLLIEANPSEQGNIVGDRPNSAVVNGAVCEKEGGNITFFDASLGGWGGVTASYDTERLTDKMSAGKEFEVPCHRLDTLVNDFRISQVDVMTVDTEGSELTALKTFPFDRVKPKLIAVEILTGTEEREAYRQQVKLFMESKGYRICKYGVKMPRNEHLFTIGHLYCYYSLNMNMSC